MLSVRRITDAFPHAKHGVNAVRDVQKQRLIRSGELAEQLGVSRTTLWRMVRDRGFPRPRQITSGIKGWLPSEVDEWLQQRTAA